MILLDTEKAAKLFAKYDVPISGYIVNRVIPKEIALSEHAPNYLRNRYDMQQKYLAKIREAFGNEVQAEVPEMERDIAGLDMIARMAEAMYEGETL